MKTIFFKLTISLVFMMSFAQAYAMETPSVPQPPLIDTALATFPHESLSDALVNMTKKLFKSQQEKSKPHREFYLGFNTERKKELKAPITHHRVGELRYSEIYAPRKKTLNATKKPACLLCKYCKKLFNSPEAFSQHKNFCLGATKMTRKIRNPISKVKTDMLSKTQQILDAVDKKQEKSRG